MIRIEPDAWQVMVSHARSTFPNECCGVVFGVTDGDGLPDVWEAANGLSAANDKPTVYEKAADGKQGG